MGGCPQMQQVVVVVVVDHASSTGSSALVVIAAVVVVACMVGTVALTAVKVGIGYGYGYGYGLLGVMVSFDVIGWLLGNRMVLQDSLDASEFSVFVVIGGGLSFSLSLSLSLSVFKPKRISPPPVKDSISSVSVVDVCRSYRSNIGIESNVNAVG